MHVPLPHTVRPSCSHVTTAESSAATLQRGQSGSQRGCRLRRHNNCVGFCWKAGMFQNWLRLGGMHNFISLSLGYYSEMWVCAVKSQYHDVNFRSTQVVSSMEHVFMNPLAIYAVVFNIVNLLNENTQQRVCNIDMSSYIILANSSPSPLHTDTPMPGRTAVQHCLSSSRSSRATRGVSQGWAEGCRKWTSQSADNRWQTN